MHRNGGRRNQVRNNTFIDCDLDIAINDEQQLSGQRAICTPPHGKMWLELQKLNYTQPPYSTRYPELLTIAGDHPCLPVHNNISDNVYCHQNSMNVSARRGFLSRPVATVVEAWHSTVASNREECPFAAANEEPSGNRHTSTGAQ